MKQQSLNRFQIGQIVRSKKGRDKDRFYMIAAKDQRFVYVANGVKWTVARPKKKNPAHLQLINRLIVTDELDAVDDQKIVQVINNLEE